MGRHPSKAELTVHPWAVSAVALGWRPKNPVSVDAAARAEVEAFLVALDDDDDVQQVWGNYEISDEIMEKLG